MKLYLLTREDNGMVYDCTHGFVIRAKSEENARKIAAENCGDEGRYVWLNKATVTILISKGEECVILHDHING